MRSIISESGSFRVQSPAWQYKLVIPQPAPTVGDSVEDIKRESSRLEAMGIIFSSEKSLK